MEDSDDVKMVDTEDNKEIEASRPQEPEVMETPLVSSSGGRRRGRRKVMKKKTIKDEEGYLGEPFQWVLLSTC
jgi:DNA polymerase delta subunit 3